MLLRSFLFVLLAWAALPLRAAELHGTVLDTVGRPLAGATVAATRDPQELDEQGQIVRHVMRSDALGRYHFEALPAGRYEISASFTGQGAGNTAPPSVQAGEVLTVAPLRIVPMAATLRGGLRTSGGPLPAELLVVAIRVDVPNGGTFYGEISPQGYALSLAPGQYLYKAVAAGHSSLTLGALVPTSIQGAVPVRDLLLQPTRGSDPGLSEQLRRRCNADQSIRHRLGEVEHTGPTEQIHALREEAMRIDTDNHAWLKQLIAQQGWPTVAQVGLEGVNAAWLLAQHAPELLKVVLPALELSAQQGELDRSSLALSIDRVLTSDGKPQRYGSQFRRGADGKLTMFPVEDEATLDVRRAAMDLDPIASYRQRLGAE